MDKLRFLLLGFCFLFIGASAFGQTMNEQIVDVKYEGLSKTDVEYLERFILTKPGCEPDSVQIEKDAFQLRSLDALANVSYRIERGFEGLILIFVCDEVQTLYPIVNFGFAKDNEWVKLGVMDVNAFGRGIELSGYYLFNDRHTFSLNFTIPHINGSKWGMNANILKWSSLEPLFFDDAKVQYAYDNNSVQLAGSYEINFRHKVELGGVLFQENYNKIITTLEDKELPGPESVSLNKYLGKFNYTINHIDYFFFYRSGFINQLSLQTVQTMGLEEHFHILTNTFKYYKRLDRGGNFAGRFIGGVGTNNKSPFSPFVIDSHQNLRGSGNRITRSTGIMVLNLEYRQTILESEDFAIQYVGFSDIGLWRNPGDAWFEQGEGNAANQAIFLGAGVRLIHKRIFNAILRFDFGVNPQDPYQNGWVIGLGQYF